jgi:hypothetical protein
MALAGFPSTAVLTGPNPAGVCSVSTLVHISAENQMATPYKRASRGPVAGRLAGKVVAISGTGGGQVRAAALLFARACRATRVC